MKVTEVRVRVLEYPLPKPFHPTWQPFPSQAARVHLVEVHTDEGIVGIGAGGVPVRWDAAGALLVGQDPFDVQRHVQNLRSFSFFVGRPWALEVALWDIIGKALGQPVYKLLGGGEERLLAYASTGEWRPPQERAEMVQQLKAQGFRAVKLRFHSPDPRDDLRVLEAVRKAVGEDMTIMVDANWGWRIAPDRQPHRWDLRTAIWVARELEQMGVYWLEEPLDAFDYRGLAELRSHLTSLRIAGGELARGPEEIALYLEKDALDVYQPDCTFVGGISTCHHLAFMVREAGKVFTPHTWTNGIGLVANMHVAAAAGGVPFLEFPFDPPAWTVEARDFLLARPVTIDAEGYVHLPQGPGLGIELDEEKLRRYEQADTRRLL